jgi:hypothetical protein
MRLGDLPAREFSPARMDEIAARRFAGFSMDFEGPPPNPRSKPVRVGRDTTLRSHPMSHTDRTRRWRAL